VAEELADPVAEAAAYLAANNRDVEWLKPSELMRTVADLRRHLGAVVKVAGEVAGEVAGDGQVADGGDQ
jgi:hypothetical protein